MSYWSSGLIDGLQVAVGGSTDSADLQQDWYDDGPLGGWRDCGLDIFGRPQRLPKAVAAFNTSYSFAPGLAVVRDGVIAMDAALGLSTDYVQLLFWQQGGPVGGFPTCNSSSYVPGYINLAELTLSGVGVVEVRSASDGTLTPVLPATDFNASSPDYRGLLMRPTSLTWPGQDPDNLANRTLWLPSEVGAFSLAVEMTDVASYNFRGTVVEAFSRRRVPLAWMCVL